MTIYIIIQVIKYKEFDIIQVLLNNLHFFPNLSTDKTVILKDKMWNEKIYLTV